MISPCLLCLYLGRYCYFFDHHGNFDGHTEPVMTVIYSSDEQHLISSGLDQTVRCWEVATGKCIQVLKRHAGLVSTAVCRSVALARDASKVDTGSPEVIPPRSTASLFSGSFDETIKRWSLETRSCLSTLRVSYPYEGMNISQDSTKLKERP